MSHGKRENEEYYYLVLERSRPDEEGNVVERRKEGLRGSKLFKRRLPSHSVLASCRSFHRYALRLWWRWTGLWNRIQIHKAFSFFNWHLWCKANAFPYNSRHIHTQHAQACDWVWLRQSGIPRVSAGIDGYQDQTMTAWYSKHQSPSISYTKKKKRNQIKTALEKWTSPIWRHTKNN